MSFLQKDTRFQDSIKEDKDGCKRKISGLLKYQGHVKRECKELSYLQLIANGVKHFRLNDEGIRQSTELHEGEFSDEFSDEFDTSGFVIKLNDKETVDFRHTLAKAIDYWRG